MGKIMTYCYRGINYIEISNSTKLPFPLKNMILKWKAFFKNPNPTYGECPVKYAAIIFDYQGILYRISPLTLGLGEKSKQYYQHYFSDQILEYYSRMIEKDLEAIGATDIEYMGMID
jgi:hypothetical protein